MPLKTYLVLMQTTVVPKCTVTSLPDARTLSTPTSTDSVSFKLVVAVDVTNERLLISSDGSSVTFANLPSSISSAVTLNAMLSFCAVTASYSANIFSVVSSSTGIPANAVVTEKAVTMPPVSITFLNLVSIIPFCIFLKKTLFPFL